MKAGHAAVDAIAVDTIPIRNPAVQQLDGAYEYRATVHDPVQLARLTPAGDMWHVRVIETSGVTETIEPVPAALTGLYLRDFGWHRPAEWSMHEPAPERSTTEDMASGFVYIVAAAGSSLVKIGYAQSVATRLRDLQCGSPLSLYVIAEFEGSRHDEADAHRRFEAHRRHGEWFEAAGVLPTVRAALSRGDTTVEAWLMGEAA